MEWFAFLNYLLMSVCCAILVWFAIKVGFRKTPPSKSILADLGIVNVPEISSTVQRQRMYWNFTATLIVVPALLLVLGITMQTASLTDPVTATLAGALLLIWGMSLWSGMLTFPDRTIEVNQTETQSSPGPVASEVRISQTTTDLQEKP